MISLLHSNYFDYESSDAPACSRFEREESSDYSSTLHFDLREEFPQGLISKLCIISLKVNQLYSGTARSAAEASMLVHDDYKFRQLPCR